MERRLNISWVIAEGYQFDPTVNVDTIKNIGPIWGSWTTWRGCGTDNVICNNRIKAEDMIKNNFQAGCNFYIPKEYYTDLNRPDNVRYYGGTFEHELDRTEDIVALHLASSIGDIILMIGFNLESITDPTNQHYYGHILSVIKNHPDTQWVLVDHMPNLDKNFKDLTNLTCDSLGNVLQLLAQ